MSKLLNAPYKRKIRTSFGLFVFFLLLSLIYTFLCNKSIKEEKLCESYEELIQKRIAYADNFVQELRKQDTTYSEWVMSDEYQLLTKKAEEYGLSIYVCTADSLVFWLESAPLSHTLRYMKAGTRYQTVNLEGEEYVYKHDHFENTREQGTLAVYVFVPLKILDPSPPCMNHTMPKSVLISPEGEFILHDVSGDPLCRYDIHLHLELEPSVYLLYLYFVTYLLLLFLLLCIFRRYDLRGTKGFVYAFLIALILCFFVYGTSLINHNIITFVFNPSQLVISDLVPSLSHFVLYLFNACFFGLCITTPGVSKSEKKRSLWFMLATAAFLGVCSIVFMSCVKGLLRNTSFTLLMDYNKVFSSFNLVVILLVFLCCFVYLLVAIRIFTYWPSGKSLRKSISFLFAFSIYSYWGASEGFPVWLILFCLPSMVMMEILSKRDFYTWINHRFGNAFPILLLGASFTYFTINYFTSPRRDEMINKSVYNMYNTLNNQKDFMLAMNLKLISDNIDKNNIVELPLKELRHTLANYTSELMFAWFQNNWNDFNLRTKLILKSEADTYIAHLGEPSSTSLSSTGFLSINEGEKFVKLVELKKEPDYYLGVCITPKKREPQEFAINYYYQPSTMYASGDGRSYAHYMNGKLVAYKGNYIYPFLSAWLSQLEHSSEVLDTPNIVEDEYSHWVFKPSKDDVFILSLKNEPKLLRVVEFLVLLIYMFCLTEVIIFLCRASVVLIKPKRSMINKQLNRIFVLFLLFLILLGTTSVFFSKQIYKGNVKYELMQYCEDIVKEFQVILHKNESIVKLWEIVDDLPNIWGSPIYFYDERGVFVHSMWNQDTHYTNFTSPNKILPLDVMNRLKKAKRGVLVEEHIGEEQASFVYYAPLFSEEGNLRSFAYIPFIRSISELQKYTSNFLAIVITTFVFMGILTYLILHRMSNNVKDRLSILRSSLQTIDIGNETISIRDSYDDEMSEVVGAYNKMLIQLKDNVNLLAQSEREGAWRTMAKQIAHEIKNPLSPMKLTLQQLKKTRLKYPEKFSEYFDKQAEMLIEQIEHLTSIASSFSQFAENTIRTDTEVDIIPVLQKLVSLYAAYEDIDVSCETTSEQVYCRGEALIYNQIFTNILKNAYQAARPDRSCEITCKVKIQASRCLISFTNNGFEIDPSQGDKIFSPNFTTKSSGMGLGLALVKKNVSELGGRIWFESSSENTTFFILLPCRLVN